MRYALPLVAVAMVMAACSPPATKAPEPPAASAPTASALKPVIADAWAAATPAGVKVSAGYMVITNPGADDRLLSVSTPAAGKSEVHTMEMDAGVMKMRAADGLAVASGATVTFAPGGVHVMFMDLPAPLAEGTTIPVTLVFEKAGTLTASFAVKQRPIDGQASKH